MSFEGYFTRQVSLEIILSRLLANLNAIRAGRRKGTRLVCKVCGYPNGRGHPWDCFGPITRPGWDVEDYQ